MNGEKIATLSIQLSSLQTFSRKYRKDFGGVLGGAIIFVFAICAVFAPYISPFNPKTPSFTSILAPPSGTHLFGTDNLGRDVLSNVIWGARISLEVGVLSGVLMLLIGLATGIAAGFFKRWDKVVMSFTDSVLMIPIVPLILVIVALFGSSIPLVILVIGATGWPQVTRVIRAETLALRKREFIDAASTSGVGHLGIIWNHVIPNELSVIFVNAALSISFGILAEAALDFLGLGSVQISWGFMLFTSLNYWLSGAWWLAVFPGLAIFLASLAFYLIGEGVSNVFGTQSTA